MDFLRSKIRLACFRLGLWLLGKSMIAFEKSVGGRRLNDLRRVTLIELDGKEYAFEGRLYIPVKPTGGDELLSASLWPDDHRRRNGIQLPGTDFRYDVFLKPESLISVTEDFALLFCAPELKCIANCKRTGRLDFEFSLFFANNGPSLQQ